MSRAMAVLLAAAAAVLALIVPLDHGAPFIVGAIATGVVMGGGTYAASTPNKKNLSIMFYDGEPQLHCAHSLGPF